MCTGDRDRDRVRAHGCGPLLYIDATLHRSAVQYDTVQYSAFKYIT
jgi:hypothetical protein